MVDLNPGKQYFGKPYTHDEAIEVDKELNKLMPTGESWWWHDNKGNEILDSQIMGSE
jgi:hypothetical protein